MSSDPSVGQSDLSYRRGRVPSGTVTFLFTDIEGSTVRWERDPRAMQDAVRLHDAILRETITAGGGYVFKTVGDAFCAAFARPDDAAHVALAVHRALAAADFSAVDGIRVRIAIHSGAADERDGDYFGTTVNRVARLLGIAHGGQSIVSGVTADLLGGSATFGATLRDLGDHRLKDLTHAVRVHQLDAVGVVADFPTLRSLSSGANNLPVVSDSLVGRDDDVAEIARLLHAGRLVTIVGAGGVGKTRTALAAAAQMLDVNEDGVWFVELAPLADGKYVTSTIALALDATLGRDEDPLRGLTALLKPRRVLLVLDNCEHLVNDVAHVLASLLAACANVTVLATSRQPLGVHGEVPYRLPSLAFPESAEDAATAARAMRFPAVALFVERARTGDRRFSLDDGNADAVAEICRRLDGIPLAIELAAARVTILAPRQLCDRIDQRFRMLSHGTRTALPRQQTLRALIDWSYDLLDDRERTLFRRLSVFAGGFALAGAIAGSGSTDEFEVLDVVGSLVDKSLLLADADASSSRFRMLESTRAYALERLDAANEIDASARRHLAHLSGLFAPLSDSLERSADPREMVATFRLELENVRAALDYGMRADAAAGAMLLVALRPFAWRSVGLDGELHARARDYLGVLDLDLRSLRARLWRAVAVVLGDWGEKARSFHAASNATDDARASGEPAVLASALVAYVDAASRTQRFDQAEAALAELEHLPDCTPYRRVNALEARGFLLFLRGDLKGSLRLAELVVRERRSFGDAAAIRVAMLNLAENLNASGDSERATATLVEILPELRRSQDRTTLGMVLVNLASYSIALDRTEDAERAAREVLSLFESGKGQSQVAIALEVLAAVFASRGDLERAATLEGYVEAALHAGGFEREATEKATFDGLRARLTAALSSDDLDRLLADGAALPAAAALALARDDPPS